MVFSVVWCCMSLWCLFGWHFLMNKWTNIAVDDGWVRSLAKTYMWHQIRMWHIYVPRCHTMFQLFGICFDTTWHDVAMEITLQCSRYQGLKVKYVQQWHLHRVYDLQATWSMWSVGAQGNMHTWTYSPYSTLKGSIWKWTFWFCLELIQIPFALKFNWFNSTHAHQLAILLPNNLTFYNNKIFTTNSTSDTLRLQYLIPSFLFNRCSLLFVHATSM